MIAKRRMHEVKTLTAAALLALVAWFCLGQGPAFAETRRAFLLGIKNYPDTDIQSLQLSEEDAKGVATDLEQVGFDKKNITTALNLRSKADFDRQFGAFLGTVKEGDVVFFYYSGHGVGLEASNTNYLLMGGVRSLFSFAKDKLPAIDKRSDDIVRLKMPTLEADYENEEIAKNGVSAQDVIASIGAKKPRIMIVMLDACRALAQSKAAAVEITRGPDSGSRLLPTPQLPPGAIVMFSASFGESAIEKFYPSENRKNSLFTEAVRSEMQRPGQTLIGYAERIGLMVSQFARNGGKQQEPDYYQNLGSDDNYKLVDSVGADRFAPKQDQCEGAKDDWDDIKRHLDLDALERHVRRYHDCSTADEARRAEVNLLASSQDPTPTLPTGNKQVDECDHLAASNLDTMRPPEAPGVALADIDYANAIPACDAAIKRNPRTFRYLYNLGSAELAEANYDVDLSDKQKLSKLKEARAAFEDAASRGYVAAIYSLATLFYDPDESEQDLARDEKLLNTAAKQQFPPAMYELAAHYHDGSHGEAQDIGQAYHWMIKAAESGSVQGMVGASKALFDGSGVDVNPRRAVEWAVRAANAGSVEAKLQLGIYFNRGKYVWSDKTNALASNSLAPDNNQALLWWGRAAEQGSAAAQYLLGQMLERGYGLPSPQPEIAERYYRLAAHGGDEDAEYELSRRLRAGVMLAKPENGDAEALDLLRRALSHGSARAAGALAEIYRNGELGVDRDPERAVEYAFEAIRLSVLADPVTPDGNPYHEMAAGILIAEMAYNNQAVDSAGRALLKPEEVARLQKFYGTIDIPSRRVKVRSFDVPLNCADPKKVSGEVWKRRRTLWVWDWGRVESPTETQFRSLERDSDCTFNDVLRQTLITAFDASKKNKVPYADLVAQEVLAARVKEDEKKK